MSVIPSQLQTLISNRTADVASRGTGSRTAEAAKPAPAPDALDLASTQRAIEAQNLSAALPGIDDAAAALAATLQAKSFLLASSSPALTSHSRLSAQNVLSLLGE